MPNRILFWTAVPVALLILSGCLTPADRWLTENLQPKEKAEILVDKGIERYNAMVENDLLGQIGPVRSAFSTALTVDPLNARAADYVKRVDSFQGRRQTETQTKVKALTAKPALSDREKFNLVVLVRQLQLLAPPNIDLTKLTAQVAPIRAEVMKRAVQTLADQEKALVSAKTEGSVAKGLSAVHGAIEELRQLDPSAPEAVAAAGRLAAFLATRNKADVDLAKKSLQQRDYAKATQALDRVEQSLEGVGSDTTAEVKELQYTVAFEWSKELFASKKYGEAGSRINDALTIKVTSEAKDLKDRIAAAAALKDFDAEYETLDRQLENLIKAGDLKTAWNLTTTSATQLRKEDNKARLAVRRKQVLEAAHKLYDDAVASYNDEDYREAKVGFDVVAAIDPGWLLVKAYQEKARAKLQALGGQ